MNVIRIEEVSKSRSRVVLDEESSFVLYKGELRQYHLKEGEEIAQEDYDTILQKLLPKRAKLRALNLLKSKDYTEQQLRIKLRQGMYPEEVIGEAVEYVKTYRYIDDVRYAKDFITCHENDRSRRRMVQDLRAKGMEDSAIEKAFLEWEKLGGNQNTCQMIQKLLEKKHYDPANTTFKEYQKLYAFLQRKGYSSSEIRSSLGDFQGKWDS